MKKLWKTLGKCLFAMSLCVLLSMEAAAADTGSSLESVKKFIASLSANNIDRMAISYSMPRESLPDTELDAADQEKILAALQGLKLTENERANPSTGMSPIPILVVESAGKTLRLNPDNPGWIGVEGSFGSITLATEDDSCYTLSDAIRTLPEVEQSLEEGMQIIDRYFSAPPSEESRTAKTMLGTDGKPNPLRENNPSALAVQPENVDYINIYNGGYYTLVKEAADQIRLLNMINFTDASLPPKSGGSDDAAFYRLEIRLKDGTKYEYTTDSLNLVVNGQHRYGDEAVCNVFDSVLGEMEQTYPRGIAWLGYMNARRITKIVYSPDGTLSETVTVAENPTRLAAIAQTLKELPAVSAAGGGFHCQTLSSGQNPSEISGLSCTKSADVYFDTGIRYELRFWGDRYITMKSSDMPFQYFYDMQE